MKRPTEEILAQADEMLRVRSDIVLPGIDVGTPCECYDCSIIRELAESFRELQETTNLFYAWLTFHGNTKDGIIKILRNNGVWE
jgi:diaminopimelate decarboxylase